MSETPDLERIASDIADYQRPDRRETSTLDGDEADLAERLHDLADIAQAFRKHRSPNALPGGRPLFRFGGLEVYERLGAGSQGEVYRARDPLLDAEVALKLKPADSSTLSSQFLAEARRLARVRHPNVLTVYGAAVHDGQAGLWTELVRGETLSALLDAGGPFPVEDVVSVGLDLCSAVAAVHRHGLIHGDIKAANVMRDRDGRIVLMDFGAASERDDVRGIGSISGTRAYLAPEVLAGALPSTASDVYAIGVTLWRLLTSDYPPDSRGGGRAPPDSPLAKKLVALLKEALQPDPKKRVASAQVLFQRLAQIDRPAPALPRYALAAAVLALVGLGAIAWQQIHAGPGWHANASIVRIGIDGSTETLSDGAAITLGDRLLLRLDSDRNSHVYVFDDDGSPDPTVLFPVDGAAASNPLPAGNGIEVPGRNGNQALTWEIDAVAERDDFVVIASAVPLPELEAAISHWRSVHGGGDNARGAGRLVAAGDGGIRSASLREAVANASRGRAEGQVRQWRFGFPQRR